MKWLFSIVLVISACNNQQVRKEMVKTHSTFEKGSISNVHPISADGKIVRFITKYNFSSFKVNLFRGKLVSPDFGDDNLSNDEEYVSFITNGCNKTGINFAGHYTIIQKAGGAMCEFIFIVDRVNGKIFYDIKLNECRYGYLYKKDSQLLIANANSFQDEHLNSYNDFFDKPELYTWRDGDFVMLNPEK